MVNAAMEDAFTLKCEHILMPRREVDFACADHNGQAGHLHISHSGLKPQSSGDASARVKTPFTPKDLGWLDTGSRPA